MCDYSRGDVYLSSEWPLEASVELIDVDRLLVVIPNPTHFPYLLA
jgi:hypothetical protein